MGQNFLYRKKKYKESLSHCIFHNTLPQISEEKHCVKKIEEKLRDSTEILEGFYFETAIVLN